MLPSLANLHQILVMTKQSTDPDGSYTGRVKRFFEEKALKVACQLVDFHETGQSLKLTGLSPDLIVVIGGDGTFLRTAQCFAHGQIPMVGVNRGNLGFLTRIETSQLETYLDRILKGDYQLEERTLLALNHQNVFAINDVVIKSKAPSQMVRLKLSIHQQLVAVIDADGMIVSTPTGSTAYNLAAGGPVLSPEVEALCVTPICSHSLSAKPIVIPANKQLTIESDATNLHGAICSVDGQDVCDIQPGESIELTQAPFSLKLLNFGEEADNFYWLLTHKLQWSGNPRQRAVFKVDATPRPNPSS